MNAGVRAHERPRRREMCCTFVRHIAQNEQSDSGSSIISNIRYNKQSGVFHMHTHRRTSVRFERARIATPDDGNTASAATAARPPSFHRIYAGMCVFFRTLLLLYFYLLCSYLQAQVRPRIILRLLTRTQDDKYAQCT